MENDSSVKTAILESENSKLILGLSFLKWIGIGIIVGLVTGIVAAIFLKSLDFVTEMRIKYSWLLFILPFGGALVSYIYLKYGKNASKGNNLIIEKINEGSGRIPLRMAPLVFFGTIITHLFGGSAGREGTGVQIGSSISEAVGRIFKLKGKENKMILMAGISSGFSSVFGTPLAGTIFGLEVASLGVMSYEALIPAFTASLVGDITVSFLGVKHSHFKIFDIPELSGIVLVKIIFAATLFGLTSRLFSKLTHRLKDFFGEKFKNPVIKSMVGGIIIIILVYITNTRKFLGLSLPLISESFNGHLPIYTFLGKIIFTALTLGAGFQGGEVTPLFVIGSTLGNSLSDILGMSPSFLAALGLIGVFAGATNAPIASFMLSLEMFGSESMLFMFMTCVISYIMSGHTGIYLSQKIGIGKSNLIEIPQNVTLLHFRQRRSLKLNFENLLLGQFNRGKSKIELPSQKGKYTYKIIVKGSGVRLSHTSYNPDGHTWSAPPGNGEKQYIDLAEGLHIIDINIGEYYGKVNKLNLINKNLFGEVEIEYSYEETDFETKLDEA